MAHRAARKGYPVHRLNPQTKLCGACVDKYGLDPAVQDVVVCPHCGHRHTDLVEFKDDGEYSCNLCERAFELEVEWRAYYSAS